MYFSSLTFAAVLTAVAALPHPATESSSLAKRQFDIDIKGCGALKPIHDRHNNEINRAEFAAAAMVEALEIAEAAAPLYSMADKDLLRQNFSYKLFFGNTNDEQTAVAQKVLRRIHSVLNPADTDDTVGGLTVHCKSPGADRIDLCAAGVAAYAKDDYLVLCEPFFFMDPMSQFVTKSKTAKQAEDPNSEEKFDPNVEEYEYVCSSDVAPGKLGYIQTAPQTILHELSHTGLASMEPHVEDCWYGATMCQYAALAKNPRTTIINADTYSWFFAGNYLSTHCKVNMRDDTGHGGNTRQPAVQGNAKGEKIEGSMCGSGKGVPYPDGFLKWKPKAEEKVVKRQQKPPAVKRQQKQSVDKRQSVHKRQKKQPVTKRQQKPPVDKRQQKQSIEKRQQMQSVDKRQQKPPVVA